MLFCWTEENIQHLEEHGISPEEFEEVVMDPDETGESRSTGRPLAIGETSTGRNIVCIYEMLDDATVYPITAYELDEA